MNDFVTGKAIDIAELEQMLIWARQNERSIRMRTWAAMNSGPPEISLRFDNDVNYCGTRACLVGTWCLGHRNADRLRLDHALDPLDPAPVLFDEHGNVVAEDYPMRSIAMRFGLSVAEAEFLFSAHNRNALPNAGADDAATLLAADAIARLHKFILYKQRKAAIFADYEQARRSGDVGVAQAIARSVEIFAASLAAAL